MKRQTLSTLLLSATVIFTAPSLYGVARAGAPEKGTVPSACAAYCRGTCEDSARLKMLRERMAKNSTSSYGLMENGEGAVRELRIIKDEAQWQELASKRPDFQDLEHSMKKHGYAVMDGVYYAVRPAHIETDVPVPSPFFGQLRQSLPSFEKLKLTGAYDETDLLSWASGQYQRNFSTSEKDKTFPQLYVTDLSLETRKRVLSRARVLANFRDLVATSLNQFKPQDGAAIMTDVAKTYNATTRSFTEHQLHEAFGMAWEVGKGSDDRPNVTILEWAPKNAAPVLTIDLAGKGVCFDTGGHNLKTQSEHAAGMFADKGGALSQLMLATLIMEADLPVRLRLANGWVVNVPGPHAQMQSDIYKTKAGFMENGDTDAEGRLVLASILNYFAQNDPAQVTMTAATLTWAQLVATGKNTGLFHAKSKDPFTGFLVQGMKDAKDPMIHHGIDPRFLADLKKASKRADLVTCTVLEGDSANADAFLRLHTSDKTQYAHADIASVGTGTSGLTPGVEDLDMFYVFGAFEAIKSYVAQIQASSTVAASSS